MPLAEDPRRALSPYRGESAVLGADEARTAEIKPPTHHERSNTMSSRYTPPRKNQKAEALAHLRMSGCDCEPILKRKNDPDYDARYSAKHDAWCAMWLRMQFNGPDSIELTAYR